MWSLCVWIGVLCTYVWTAFIIPMNPGSIDALAKCIVFVAGQHHLTDSAHSKKARWVTILSGSSKLEVDIYLPSLPGIEWLNVRANELTRFVNHRLKTGAIQSCEKAFKQKNYFFFGKTQMHFWHLYQNRKQQRKRGDMSNVTQQMCEWMNSYNLITSATKRSTH